MRQFLLLMLVFVGLTACGGGDDSSDSPSNENPSTSMADTPQATVPVENNTPEIAALVNGSEITLQELNQAIARREAGSTAQAADPQAQIATVLQELIDRKLIEQAATQLGIQVSDEQVQAEIDALAAIAAQQGISVDDFFIMQGFTAEDYPAELRMNLLTGVVSEQITSAVNSTTVQVLARHILVADEATARSIIEQLNNGADFGALAQQYSLDGTSKNDGGNLGWIAPGDLIQKEVEAAIFALPDQTLKQDPVRSVLGYHVVETLERAEGRALDPTTLASIRNQVWQDWLQQQRAAADIVRYVGPNAQQ